ncbi:hypothetical protein QMK17_20260 [Rhodococcus sp. G-MC3]|uniref:hypothetical protein n=1 Tax=Rhodococcus sp. G-MC3 TaxID=3046209 RepID=UPI0024B89DFD|nr:hypothetical protein [Rhodococcus sp. G-MC3]MDJ0395659.1 hypothetical protein [Rhodococcus sp. G-MC3]
MRPTAPLTLALVGACLLITSSCSYGLQVVGIDTVSFTPPSADVVAAPECMAEDIFTALTGMGPWDPAIASPAPDPGYPPVGFDPVEVVRCENGVSDQGLMSVDSVVLQGDIDAVDEAFSAKSVRYADNISASCVYAPEVPAGLWLVDAEGRAFRPVWPSGPCGLQEQPLRALQSLDEVSRSAHPTGVVDGNRSCAGTSGEAYFETTTVDDVAASARWESETGQVLPPTLVMPISDVALLQICRYHAAEAEAGQPNDLVPGSLLAVSRPGSAELIDKLVNAPIARACSQQATRIASMTLLRPDGSGGARVHLELDGCTRVSGFGADRQVPADVLEILLRDD